MEEVIMYVINTLIQFADKHEWLAYTLMVIGGLYVFLTAIRGFLTVLVKATKTEKDNKVVDTVFAFLDKFAYGFGKLGDYFEKKMEEKKKVK
jgi:hypothetical protein